MEEQEREFLMENASRLQQWEETPAAPSGRFSDMTEMEKDKLLDYMFAQNSKLTDRLAGVSGELRLQREQAERHHKDLKSSLARMEERAMAAERRADAEARRATMESEARVKAEKRIEELLGTIDSLMDGSLIQALNQRIIDLTRQCDDAKASDKHNRAERYGRTGQKIKDTPTSEADVNDRDATSSTERASRQGRLLS